MFLSHLKSHVSLFVLVSLPLFITSRKTLIPSSTAINTTTETFGGYGLETLDRFVNARRGCTIGGLSKLKQYFHRFGYLTLINNSRFTDSFDMDMELAVSRYQEKLGLPVTSKLDINTLRQIAMPRCGEPDGVGKFIHLTERYVYFTGKPRWWRQRPMTLTYAFSPQNLIDYLSLQDIRRVFKCAFSSWSSVVPITFVEIVDYGFADIKIGFYIGDHGDGEAFDGVLGILAHSFSPENGKLHLDASERWAIDFASEHSKVAVDLESVVVHEIGHLLGLAHSSAREAIMYPSLKPRERKVDLTFDDVKGVQSLYGKKRNSRFGSMLVSQRSSTGAPSLTGTMIMGINGRSPALAPLYILLGLTMMHVV